MSYKPRYQWETNSAPSQSNNCGPTCAAAIAGFYNNNTPGIEATRRLVVGPYTPTTYVQQRDMLIRRGVPAAIYNITSLGQLRSFVSGGQRPVTLFLNMGRIPASVRGHSFTGWHAVVCRGWGYHNGQRGFWINDPNFSPPGGVRPDPTGGNRFYSDSVLQYAFVSNSQHYALIPTNPKQTATSTSYVYFNKGVFVSLRTSPDARKNNAYAVANWAAGDIRRVSDNKWIGNVTAKRTLYAVVNGYRADGARQTYNKLRLAGTGVDVYVDSRFMHR